MKLCTKEKNRSKAFLSSEINSPTLKNILKFWTKFVFTMGNDKILCISKCKGFVISHCKNKLAPKSQLLFKSRWIDLRAEASFLLNFFFRAMFDWSTFRENCDIDHRASTTVRILACRKYVTVLNRELYGPTWRWWAVSGQAELSKNIWQKVSLNLSF